MFWTRGLFLFCFGVFLHHGRQPGRSCNRCDSWSWFIAAWAEWKASSQWRARKNACWEAGGRQLLSSITEANSLFCRRSNVGWEGGGALRPQKRGGNMSIKVRARPHRSSLAGKEGGRKQQSCRRKGEKSGSKSETKESAAGVVQQTAGAKNRAGGQSGFCVDWSRTRAKTRAGRREDHYITQRRREKVGEGGALDSLIIRLTLKSDVKERVCKKISDWTENRALCLLLQRRNQTDSCRFALDHMESCAKAASQWK